MAWTPQLNKEDWMIDAQVLRGDRVAEMERRRSDELERRLDGVGLSALSCTSWTVVKQQGVNLRLAHLKCKRWSCKRCARTNKKRLKWIARNGHPQRFITLTAHKESADTTGGRARELVRAWREIRRRYSKKWTGAKIEFLAIFEKTKKGEPHLHIMVRSNFIEKHWLSSQMDSLTGSPICHIRKIDSSAMAANYVSKYIAKDPTRFAGTKRFWRSMGYFIQNQMEEGKEEIIPSRWHLVRQKPSTIVPPLTKMGFYFIELAEIMHMVWYGTGPPPLISNYV